MPRPVRARYALESTREAVRLVTGGLDLPVMAYVLGFHRSAQAWDALDALDPGKVERPVPVVSAEDARSA